MGDHAGRRAPRPRSNETEEGAQDQQHRQPYGLEVEQREDHRGPQHGQRPGLTRLAERAVRQPAEGELLHDRRPDRGAEREHHERAVRARCDVAGRVTDGGVERVMCDLDLDVGHPRRAEQRDRAAGDAEKRATPRQPQPVVGDGTSALAPGRVQRPTAEDRPRHDQPDDERPRLAGGRAHRAVLEREQDRGRHRADDHRADQRGEDVAEPPPRNDGRVRCRRRGLTPGRRGC